jgi:hypothetical protein
MASYEYPYCSEPQPPIFHGALHGIAQIPAGMNSIPIQNSDGFNYELNAKAYRPFPTAIASHIPVIKSPYQHHTSAPVDPNANRFFMGDPDQSKMRLFKGAYFIKE